MIRFAKRILIFGTPLIVLVLSYFYFDPFSILHFKGEFGSNYLRTCNRNALSTNSYLENKDKLNFRSFIFGSSRSSAFRTYDWAKQINDPAPYHFDAFNDNINGMKGKIEFIEKSGSKIDNALIIIDSFTFSEIFDDSKSLVHLKDYRWSGQNFILYHLEFFKAFFKKQYLWKYFDAKISKKYKKYMGSEISEFKYFYKAPYNDFYFPDYEELIRKDSVKYFNNPEFKTRGKKTVLEPLIKTHHIEDLKKIVAIFERNKTNVKIVIAPIFDQRNFNPTDVEILNIYFGKQNVFDFSGKNKYTDDITNYYEVSHFRPFVGKGIMEEIYKPKSL